MGTITIGCIIFWVYYGEHQFWILIFRDIELWYYWAHALNSVITIEIGVLWEHYAWPSFCGDTWILLLLGAPQLAHIGGMFLGTIEPCRRFILKAL